MRHSRRHREEEPEVHLVHDESNWLVSYADLMTLLFGFFILMYSLSKIDNEKFEVVQKDLVKYFGGPLHENPGALDFKKKMEALMDQLNGTRGEENKLVAFEQSSNQIRMSFQSQVFFQSGSAEISSESAKIIDTISQELKKIPTGQMEVEGHTDSAPIQSLYFPSNWELSSARAARIVRRMIENGLEGKKMVAQGYADSRPFVPHYDETGKEIEENRVKNRRVVLVVKLGHTGSQQQQILEKQGFRSLASEKSPEDLIAQAEGEANTAETEDLKKKLFNAQVKYRDATQKLKSVQDLEKSIKEMELLTKKTEEVERKIQSVEKKTEETLNKAQKVMQNKGN
jgi:chemotaxis protein MotB